MDENAPGPSTGQRTGEAVLNEVLVNASALREVVTTGQVAEVSLDSVGIKNCPHLSPFLNPCSPSPPAPL